MSAPAPVSTSPIPRAGHELRRLTRHETCRACGRPGGHGCAALASGWALCFHAESDHPAPRGGGWAHPPADWTVDDWRNRPAAPPAPPEREPDPEQRRCYFAMLLDLLDLSDRHRADLERRGLTAEQIERGRFRTLPPAGPKRDAIATSLQAAFGGAQTGDCPGLDALASTAAKPCRGGLFVPMADDAGRVQGAQIRRNDGGSGPRYVWLSGPGQPSGAPCAVIRPKTLKLRGVVLIVEGFIKGLITADALGVVVVVVPGVTVIRDVPSILSRLHATMAVIAYDADLVEKPEVASAEQRLAALLQDHRFPVMRLRWDLGEGKGIDDMLQAGGAPLWEMWPGDATPEPPTPNHAPAADIDPERALRLLSLATAGHANKALSVERHTAALTLLRLAPTPEGRWIPMTDERLAETAGISLDAAAKHRERLSEATGGVLDFKKFPIPGSPKDAWHVRRLGTVEEGLRYLAAAGPTHDKDGKPIKRGGDQRCPNCGSYHLRRVVTLLCIDCGSIVAETKRDLPVPEPEPTPYPQLAGMDEPEECFPSVTTFTPQVAGMGEAESPVDSAPAPSPQLAPMAVLDGRLREAAVDLASRAANAEPDGDVDLIDASDDAEPEQAGLLFVAEEPGEDRWTA